ncbi:hypothetical protein ACFV27_25810 [Streptomyces antimycoticus]|uniref:SalK n=1 Tax=Streptomyces malaysiensis subsp. samsunensis TaxID=459658 RepID=A0A9X2RYU6_STRMQ|nr:hypothetical protein [Streptomyces samsunensis]MCQ8835976.1 hypothetical protein [Streptomyces samsunensis]
MSRDMWARFEAYYDVIYAPEVRTAAKALGCKGGWMAYFALRAAPLGAASPDVVTAAFFNFHPEMVARALPDAWTVATPDRYLDSRLEVVDAALHRMLGTDVRDLTEAASLATTAAQLAPTGGRVLGAANQALLTPSEPHLALWQACSTLRESRGDGHVAALVAVDLSPCEALVLFTADKGLDPAFMRQMRGWSEEEWRDAEASLTDRGLISDVLTPAGRGLREEIERMTDAAAARPWRALGSDGTARLRELLTPIALRISDQNEGMRTNPMGFDADQELQPQPAGHVDGG